MPINNKNHPKEKPSDRATVLHPSEYRTKGRQKNRPPTYKAIFEPKQPKLQQPVGIGSLQAHIGPSPQPPRAEFFPNLQPNSPAIGQKYGEKQAAAVNLQPTTSKSGRLLAA
jgi:hypothetical protein